MDERDVCPDFSERADWLAICTPSIRSLDVIHERSIYMKTILGSTVALSLFVFGLGCGHHQTDNPPTQTTSGTVDPSTYGTTRTSDGTMNGNGGSTNGTGSGTSTGGMNGNDTSGTGGSSGSSMPSSSSGSMGSSMSGAYRNDAGSR